MTEISTPSAVSRTCIFCGRTPLTKEHVVPQWLEKVLLEVSPAPDGFHYGYQWVDSGGASDTITYSPKKPEMIYRGVCEGCNCGWMADLEGVAQPVLGPLVRGEVLRLDESAQVLLATWACKTAILSEAWCQGGVFGEAELAPLRDRQEPPSSLQVRLRQRADGRETPHQVLLTAVGATPLGSVRSEDDAPSEPNAFLCTLGLGMVAIQVWGGAGMANPTRFQDGARFPLTVWPPTPGGLAWPPALPPISGREELRVFHEEVMDRVVNPNFPRPEPPLPD